MLSFSYYALEIQEAEMPLNCKPFARGQIVPEMLVVLVYGRQQATCFRFPKQVCLIHLHECAKSHVGRRFAGWRSVRMYACS